MPMPEAAVNEDGGFVFGQDDVGADVEQGTSVGCRVWRGLKERSVERGAWSELRGDFGWDRNPDVEAEAVAHAVEE
jgi:hypothetical protein